MKKILASDGLDQSAVKALEEAGFETVLEHYGPDELPEKIGAFDALVVRSATKVRKPLIDQAVSSGRLKLIIRAGVGVDNIDVDYACEKGLTVKNTPNASSASVAELAVGHMFAAARHIHIANVTMRNGEWNKKQYKGIELSGKTLGLIGMGRIARETALRAQALGMQVIYTNRSGHKPEYEPFRHCTLDALLAESDFISLHLPKPQGEGYLIGERELSLMKDGAVLINTARGGLVDEDALCDALDSGKLSAAAVDVFAEEPANNRRLTSHPKVSVTPHIGASTKEAQLRIGREIVDIIKEFFA